MVDQARHAYQSSWCSHGVLVLSSSAAVSAGSTSACSEDLPTTNAVPDGSRHCIPDPKALAASPRSCPYDAHPAPYCSEPATDHSPSLSMDCRSRSPYAFLQASSELGREGSGLSVAYVWNIAYAAALYFENSHLIASLHCWLALLAFQSRAANWTRLFVPVYRGPRRVHTSGHGTVHAE